MSKLKELSHDPHACTGSSIIHFNIEYYHLYYFEYYHLFTFSWPRFESGSLRNGGMLILRIYFAVDGMPLEMYGESWIAGLLTSDDVYMVGFETMRGI